MYSSFVVPWKLGERICYPLCYQPWPQPPLGPQPYLFLCLGTVMVAGKTLERVEVLWHWEGRGWCTKALVTISSNSCLHLSGEDSRSLGPPARVLRGEGWMNPTTPQTSPSAGSGFCSGWRQDSFSGYSTCSSRDPQIQLSAWYLAGNKNDLWIPLDV